MKYSKNATIVLEGIIEYYEKRDITDILECLNVKIIEKDLNDEKLGYSYHNTIIIEETLNRELKLFVISHELGHLMIHSNDSYICYDHKKEKESNDFALLLLEICFETNAETIRLRLNDIYNLNI